MRVLIIGGTGAAGSRVAAEARRRDHEVVIASRTTAIPLGAPDDQADRRRERQPARGAAVGRSGERLDLPGAGGGLRACRGARPG